MRYTSYNIPKKYKQMNRKQIGNAGEEAATVYLKKNGYNIVERNFCVYGGEIDIIAEQNGTLVFIEVKSRKSRNYGNASEYVDIKKQHRIENTALMYCGGECNMRFDIIEVYYEQKYGEVLIKEINHIENAF